MIEQKDYLLRLIRRIIEVVAHILAGNQDKIEDQELNDMLADLAGLPDPLLATIEARTIEGLIRHLPDPNRVALVGAILLAKGKIARRQQWCDAGQRLLEGISPDQLLPETQQMLARLQALKGSS